MSIRTAKPLRWYLFGFFLLKASKLGVHLNPGSARNRGGLVAAFRLIPLTSSRKDRESNSRRFWPWTDLLPSVARETWFTVK